MKLPSVVKVPLQLTLLRLIICKYFLFLHSLILILVMTFQSNQSERFDLDLHNNFINICFADSIIYNIHFFLKIAEK